MTIEMVERQRPKNLGLMQGRLPMMYSINKPSKEKKVGENERHKMLLRPINGRFWCW